MSKRYSVATGKITEWKEELLKNAGQAFEKPSDDKRKINKPESDKSTLGMSACSGWHCNQYQHP